MLDKSLNFKFKKTWSFNKDLGRIQVENIFVSCLKMSLKPAEHYCCC